MTGFEQMREEAPSVRLVQRALGPIASTVEELLREERSNGGILMFSADIEAPWMHEFCKTHPGTGYEHHIVRDLVFHPQMGVALPELRVSEATTATRFDLKNAFSFHHKISAELYAGGAYTVRKKSDTGGWASTLATAYCEELFGLRFTEFRTYGTNVSWTPWFASDIWSETLASLDTRNCRFHFIAMTDTD